MYNPIEITCNNYRLYLVSTAKLQYPFVTSPRKSPGPRAAVTACVAQLLTGASQWPEVKEKDDPSMNIIVT
jgi:hypothetical protein